MAGKTRNGSAWWSASRGLPTLTYQAWSSSLTDRIGRPGRILAWARTRTGYYIGSPAVLSWGDASWQHLGWHQIQRGEWNAEARELRWTQVAEPGVSGVPGSVTLVEPGRLPELFRERIAASIAVERFAPIEGNRGVTVTARRDLAEGGGISWHADLTRGLTWQVPGVREAADRALADLQSEYDIS